MDDLYLTPLYTQSEAAGMLGLPQSTFNHWAAGYETASGNRKPGFITIERPGRGYTVPFVASPRRGLCAPSLEPVFLCRASVRRSKCSAPRSTLSMLLPVID